MTAIANRKVTGNAPWSSMPGWGIVADLTPPELVAARKLTVLRKIIGGVLIAVLLLCIGGFFLAHQKQASAEEALTAANDRSVSITAKRGRYSIVTRVEAATGAAAATQAGLMTNDVDVATLLGKITAAAPDGVRPTSITVSLVPAATGGAAGGTSTGPAASGTAGTVSMTGTARRFTDVADFVTQLNGTAGFTGVIPTSNSVGSTNGTSSTGTKSGSAWTMTFGLTEQIYSQRFATGSAAAGATNGGATTAQATVPATGGK